MTKKLIPKLAKGKKLLKGQKNLEIPELIFPSPEEPEYSMTPEGLFILEDPETGEWLRFDDMATRDSIAFYSWPFESTADAEALPIINGRFTPNRKHPYYVRAQELAEQLKKRNKLLKKKEKKKKGGVMKGLNNIKISSLEKTKNRLFDWIKTKEVSEGFTLSDYAKIYGLSLDELLRFNPQIKDKDKIIAGLTIYIPRGELNYNPGEIVELDNPDDDHGSYIYAKGTWFNNNKPHNNQTFERLPGGKYFLNPFFEANYEPIDDNAWNTAFYRIFTPDIPYEDLYKLSEEAERSGKYMLDLIDDYRNKKYGEEEQEFLRNNQLYMSDRPVGLPIKYLYTYHNIPDTDAGHYIVKQINGIDKSKLKPGYTINSYMYDNGLNSPVSVIRDEKGRRVFVIGNEDILIGSGHTPTYLLTIGDDFFYPDYLLQYK